MIQIARPNESNIDAIIRTVLPRKTCAVTSPFPDAPLAAILRLPFIGT